MTRLLATCVSMTLCVAVARAQDQDSRAAGGSGLEVASSPESVVDATLPPAAGSDTGDGMAQAAEGDDAHTDADVDADAGREPPVRLHVAAGLGMGTRSFQLPTQVGIEVLPETGFAAVDASLRVQGRLSERLALELLLRYQGSLGMTVESRPSFALPVEQDARSQRAEVGVAPVFSLGAGANEPAVAANLGFSIRSFFPDVRNQPTPAYYLAGPHLRLELRVPVTSGLSLRVGPEAQWVVAINDSLTNDGVERGLLALGVEAAAALQLSERFALELAYRQAQAGRNGDGGVARFEDVERFAILRLEGRL